MERGFFFYSPIQRLAMACLFLGIAADHSGRAGEGPVEVVDLEGASNDPAPIRINTVFKVSAGEGLWDETSRHMRLPLDAFGGQPCQTKDMMINGFHSMRRFRSERWRASRPIGGPR